jgi:hypothetical protein
MSIETWGDAPPLRRSHRPAPAAPKPRVIPARKKPLNAMQQDLVTLKLSPHMHLYNPRHFRKAVNQRWNPIDESEDLRPEGWGWEQQQAYLRVSSYLRGKECREPTPSKDIIGKGVQS